MEYRALNKIGELLASWSAAWSTLPARFSQLVIWLTVVYAGLVLLGGVSVYRPTSQNLQLRQRLAAFFPYPVAIVGPSQTSRNPLRLLSIRFIPYKDLWRESGALGFFEQQAKGVIDDGANERQAVQREIESIVVSREARRLGVVVTGAAARQELTTLANPHGGVSAYREQVLKKFYGIDESFFLDRWIPDKLYRLNLVAVRARHILVTLPQPASDKQAAEGKKKIDAILARIKAGEPFDAVARQFSEDQATKDTGGEINGFFGDGDAASQVFEDTALSGHPGELLGPVRSEFGWHLILIEERKGKIDTAFRPWLNSIMAGTRSIILDRSLR